MDPRTKIVCTLLYLISLFLFKSFWGYLAATVFLAAVIKISKVPFKFMMKGMRAIVMLLVITSLFNLFLTPGETLASFWIFTITKEGLRTAVFMAFMRIYLHVRIRR